LRWGVFSDSNREITKKFSRPPAHHFFRSLLAPWLVIPYGTPQAKIWTKELMIEPADVNITKL